MITYYLIRFEEYYAAVNDGGRSLERLEIYRAFTNVDGIWVGTSYESERVSFQWHMGESRSSTCGSRLTVDLIVSRACSGLEKAA